MTSLELGKRKLIIGMVHLLPLPGSPDYKNNFEDVRRRAVQDAQALAEGGIDGMLVQNRWDRATSRDASSPETVAAMTVITQEIVGKVGAPVGVHILRNDFIGSLAVAKVCGAAFIRATAVVGATYLAHGILEARPEEYIRYQTRMAAQDVQIMADIWSMHYKPLVLTPVEEIARQASSMRLADAVVVAVTDAGEMYEMVKTIKAANAGLPVILGGYTNAGNIGKLLSVADGAIVGRAFERDAGKQQGEVLASRVREFMQVARAG